MSVEPKSNSKLVRIDLTPDQQSKLMREIGKQAEAIELTVGEFEDRIAPNRGFIE